MSQADVFEQLRDVLVGRVGPLAQDRFDLHEVERFASDELVGQPLNEQLLVCEQLFAAVELFEDDLGLLLVRELREPRVLCRSSR